MEKIKIVYRNISELIEAEYNPRKATTERFEQIKSSLLRFKCIDPIIINVHPDRKNIIIGGHQRVRVARELDMKQLPCIELSLTPDKERELNIRLNKNTGEWDMELLGKNFDFAELAEWGFSEDELNFDFADDAEDGLTDPDDVPDLRVDTITKPGDMWLLGNHKLLCGDATIPEDIQRLVGGDEIRLLLTDPPYNLAIENSSGLTIQNDNKDSESFRVFLESAFLASSQMMSPGTSFYIFHSETESANFRLASNYADLVFRQTLFWVKNVFAMDRHDYHYQAEAILYGWKPGASHRWFGDRKQSNVLNYDRPRSNDLHPTMKPVEMLIYLLQNSTQRNEAVLDPFGGSGSTMIACEQLDRKCRMVEIDGRYCDVIVKRWEDFTGRKAVHIAA